MTRWISTPLAEPIGNQTVAGRNRFSWPQFDSLPPPVREVIAFAPVKLGTQRAYDALMSGAPISAVVRQEVTLCRRFVGAECLMTYGPDHPQAARPPSDA